MITLASLLFSAILSLTSPVPPTNTANATPPPVKCRCQDIGHKQW